MESFGVTLTLLDPFVLEGLDFRFDKFANAVPQVNVRLFIVWRREALVPVANKVS